MQQLSHIGNARREERMLLSALIELRSEQGEDTLTADAVDVSPSGLAVRAAFVPEVGTRLYCHFRCGPHSEAVYALGEVVWSAWDEPLLGSFGMRFLELDTKSATAIRRYLESDPREVEQPQRARGAMMRIDGVNAPIEADVKLLEKGCVILEQELAFLRLGRGIEVDVPGRDTRRGRIASIELRQGPFDTPTLVFGVLFDETRQTTPTEVSLGAAARRAPAFSSQGRDEPPAVQARSVRSDDVPRVVRHVDPPASSETAARDSDDDADEQALQNRLPEVMLWLSTSLKTLLIFLREKLLPGVRAVFARSVEQLDGLGGEGEASWGEQLRTQWGRARYLVAAQWGKLSYRRSQARRRTTAPSLRVQKAQPPVRIQRGDQPAPRKIGRFVTAALALMGVGLGVYALAPRSGADRIRVRQRSEQPAEGLPTLSAAAPSGALQPEAAVGAAHASAPKSEQPPSLPGVAPNLGIQSVAARFGEAHVPNGRSFVLRMSGPVEEIEGEQREDGFSVRVPGRLALDRASPIATSHRAVARALILNRGDYAELTVEFLPGMRPKYQVVGKGNAIELTLERL